MAQTGSSYLQDTLVLLEFDAEEASSASIVTSESSTELLMSLRVAQEQ